MTRHPRPVERRTEQLEQALEYLARGWPNPTGEETPAQLIGTIFDMQNFASAALAGLKPISGRRMADILSEAGVMTMAARTELEKIFNGRRKP